MDSTARISSVDMHQWRQWWQMTMNLIFITNFGRSDAMQKKKYLDAKFCVVWKQIASILTGLWSVLLGNFVSQMWPFQFVSHTKWAFFQKLLHYVEREQCFFQDKFWLLTFDESACWYFLATQLTRMWTMAKTILLYLHLAIVVDSSVG